MLKFESRTLRGMTMYRKWQIGRLVYEADRSEGYRHIYINND